ncbi:uncharacterized protein LOC117128059 [Brassica rapa]|uniref:uncharacterized protein LOC117128059 n=1 Tax=Brassica campestris TaxID=3711 RepID=UPI00142E8A0D|nr:uncharacterized protein LOC117128059 [Brassica rapa]
MSIEMKRCKKLCQASTVSIRFWFLPSKTLRTRCLNSSDLRNLLTPSTLIKHDASFNATYPSSRSVSPPIKSIMNGQLICSSTIESTLMPATVNVQPLSTFRHRPCNQNYRLTDSSRTILFNVILQSLQSGSGSGI